MQTMGGEGTSSISKYLITYIYIYTCHKEFMVQIQLCLFLLGSHISSPRLGQVSNADAHGQMWTCSDYHLATRYKFAIIGQFWGERTDAESWLTWLNLNLH